MKLFLLIILLFNTASFTFAKETKMFCGGNYYKLNSGWFNKGVLIRDKDEWVSWCTEDQKPSGKLTLDETSAECEREDGITIRLDFEINKRSLSFPVSSKAFYQKSFTCWD